MTQVQEPAVSAEPCRDKWRIDINLSIDQPLGDDADSRRIAGMFGLRGRRQELYRDFRLEIAPGQLVVITGPSGSGKSALLTAIRQAMPDAIELEIDTLADCDLPAVAAISAEFMVRSSHFPGGTACSSSRVPCAFARARLSTLHRHKEHCLRANSATQEGTVGDLAERLALLSRCGLAEAQVLVTPARRLSGGQLYRLALARAIWRARTIGRAGVILADEFGSALDDSTAEQLARQMKKLAVRHGLGIVLATPRAGLLDALAYDRLVIKPLGAPARVVGPAGSFAGREVLRARSRAKPVHSARRTTALRAGTCEPYWPGESRRTSPEKWPIVRGTMADYHALAPFHYVAGRPAAVNRIWTIRVPRRLRRPGCPAVAAVLVVSPPVLSCFGRDMATGGRYRGNLTAEDAEERRGKKEELLEEEREAPKGKPAEHRLGCSCIDRNKKNSVSSLPPLRSSATSAVSSVSLLNEEVECISRVIVHPLYRSCGLAVRLVRQALRRAGRPYVEALAVMGAVHPMFELAGMINFGRFDGKRRSYNYYFAPART